MTDVAKGRLEYLEEVSRRTGEMLDRIVDMSENEVSLRAISSVMDILVWGKNILATFSGFDVISFFLVDEESMEFMLSFCSDREYSSHVANEVAQLVENGHFGYVVQSGKASKVNDRRGDLVVLHPLVTASKEIGMFVGIKKRVNGVSDEAPPCLDSCLSIVLQRIALMIENFETYQALETANDTLERKNQINVSKLCRAERRDSTTGLANRSSLMKAMAEWMVPGERDDRRLALILLDVNRFKDLNDAVGNKAGDMILREIGARIKTATRRDDVVARLAGDEFGILAGFEGSRKEVSILIDRIVEAVERPIRVADGVDIRPSVRIGISLYPEHADNPDDTWKNAQTAMEISRKQRLVTSNRQFYVPSGSDGRIDKLVLLTHLREAIEHRDIDLFFQPKKDLRTGKLCGAEALARWISEDRGFVSPGEFIPLAEKSGFIKDLTACVLEKGFWCISRMGNAGFNIPVSLNLSMLNLQDPSLFRFVGDKILEFGVNPEMVEFEMTESALVEQSEIVQRNLDAFKDMGIRLSIDDFGTGFSSYSYLVGLNTPLDAIKIDMSFVQGVLVDNRKRIVVESIVETGHRFGMEVVAEGVESEREELFLKDMGCDMIQGFHYSKPLPKKEFSRFLNMSDIRSGRETSVDKRRVLK